VNGGENLNCCVNLKIPMGYNIIEKKRKVDVWEAEKILKTKKQRYYTTAKRNNTEVELAGSYLICPYCYKEFVANTGYSNFEFATRIGQERIPEEKILAWSSTQLSFFDDDCGEKILPISSPVNKTSSFKCPECGNVSTRSENVKQVELIKNKKKIIVKSEIVNISEIFGFKWIVDDVISVAFPMYEVLTFNMRKGRVHIKLINDKAEVLSQRDITGHPELLEGSVAYRLIELNKNVKRNIKRMFIQVWGDELPYRGKEVTINNLFKMTMFVGYPKDFYSEIPYELKSIKIDDSFEKQAKKIHFSSNVMSVFEESKLPKVKSIRRIFFGNPGLLFYIDEAELMWEAIKDYNLYCDFMKLLNIYEILSDIHMRPGIIAYIKDFCEIKGARPFINCIRYGWRDVLLAAIDYSCSSLKLRNIIQDNWLEERSIGRIVRRKPVYSVPMHKPEDGIVDCNIDGYDFFWLRNSNEYEMAGTKLKNCLSSWEAWNSPVVCVKKKDEYLAAIEVSDGKIMQARGYDNSSIGRDKNLSIAFEKWQKRFQIEWQEFDDEDDDDEFLPGLD